MGFFFYECTFNIFDMSTPIQFLEDYKNIHDERNTTCRIFFKSSSEKISIAENFLKQVVDTCDFCMCMPFEGFIKALMDNEIKEMSETGSGSTNGGLEVRREAIQNLYGLDTTKYPVKEMPKYGLLVGPDSAKDLIRDPDVFYHYGQVMVTFRKENLMDRTTMTVGSGLNFLESLLKSPTFVKDPKFICIKGLPKKVEMLRKGFFMGLNFMADYLIKEKQLQPEYPNSIALLSDDMLGFENFEIQIFGKITFSEDVKEVCYMPLGNDKEQDFLKEAAPLLNKYNLTLKAIF